MEVENTFANRSLSPLPNSKVKKRLIAADKEPDNKENIPTTPPTTFCIPKSSTPKAFNITREVYSDTNILKSMRQYSIKVFLAIRLVFSEWVVIGYISFEVFVISGNMLLGMLTQKQIHLDIFVEQT